MYSGGRFHCSKLRCGAVDQVPIAEQRQVGSRVVLAWAEEGAFQEHEKFRMFGVETAGPFRHGPIGDFVPNVCVLCLIKVCISMHNSMHTFVNTYKTNKQSFTVFTFVLARLLLGCRELQDEDLLASLELDAQRGLALTLVRRSAAHAELLRLVRSGRSGSTPAVAPEEYVGGCER